MRCLLQGMQGTAPTFALEKGSGGSGAQAFLSLQLILYFCSKGNIFATVTQSGIEA